MSQRLTAKMPSSAELAHKLAKLQNMTTLIN
jgi:hypothetical protein